MEILLGLAFIVILIWAISGGPSSDVVIQHKPCSKDPTKKCPYIISISPNGSMSSDGHLKCCKVRDQFKSMNEMFCKMNPGVDYNGISITKSVHESALRQKEYYDKLDTSGPLE